MKRFGQGLVEYGLILGLIAVLCIAAMNYTRGIPTHPGNINICTEWNVHTKKCRVDELIEKVSVLEKQLGR